MYGSRFYERQEGGSLRSARRILPYVIDILSPRSVLDIGCGLGTWISICEALGVKDVLGIDGDYINRDKLYIDSSRFIGRDISREFDLKRKYDLTISLEVAEHIPKNLEQTYFRNLVRHSDVVLFGAAIPHQGGKGHVNEQWQNYWVAKFDEKGFQAIDYLRGKFWNDPDVEWWYKQNTFLFAKSGHPLLTGSTFTNPMPINIVHPSLFDGVSSPDKMSLRRFVRLLPSVVVSSIRRLQRELA